MTRRGGGTGGRHRTTIKRTVRIVTPDQSDWQYINLRAGRARNGRLATITAQLTPAKAGTTIHWELEEGPNNRPGLSNANKGGLIQVTDGPDTDPDDDAQSTTDGTGRARIVLKLSRYGGDRFKVHAGLQSDDMTTESGWLTVWRKLWYQLTRDPVINVPSLDSVKRAYRRVFVDLARAGSPVDYDQNWLDGVSPGTNNYYPLRMVQPGAAANSMVPVVGTHSQNEFRAHFAAETDAVREGRKAHVVVIGAQYDRDDSVFDFRQTISASPCELMMPRAVLSPTIGKRGYIYALDWFVAGWFKLSTASGGFLGIGSEWRALAATDIQLLDNRGAGQDRRDRPKYLQVTLPLLHTDPAPSPVNTYDVWLRLIGVDGPYMGVSFGAGSTANVCSAEYANMYPNTVAHEIGHAVNMTPVDRGENPTHPAGFGLAQHAHAYQGKGGQGPHCHSVNNGAGDQPGVLQPNGEYLGNSGTCIMFHKSHPGCLGVFCAVCEPYLRAEAMTSLR